MNKKDTFIRVLFQMKKGMEESIALEIMENFHFRNADGNWQQLYTNLESDGSKHLAPDSEISIFKVKFRLHQMDTNGDLPIIVSAPETGFHRVDLCGKPIAVQISTKNAAAHLAKHISSYEGIHILAFEPSRKQTEWQKIDFGQVFATELVTQCEKLVGLILEGFQSIEDIGFVSRLKELKTLHLIGCDKLQNIEPVNSLMNLADLAVFNCDSFADASAATCSDRLEVLSICNCRALSVLPDLTSAGMLRIVDLGGCESLIDLSPLRGCSELHALTLTNCSCIENLQPLAELTSLRFLFLGGCKEISDISPLSEIRCVERLIINGTKVSDLLPLNGLKQLAMLSMSGCDLINNISALHDLDGIELIDLSWNSSLVDLSPLSRLTTLKDVNLSECRKVSDLYSLGSLRNLTSLNLRNCISVQDLTPLAGATNLKHLDLTGCECIHDLRPLTYLEKLEAIKLACCNRVTDLHPISKIQNLREIDLGFNGFLVGERLRPLGACRHLEKLTCIDAIVGAKVLLESAMSRNDIPALLATSKTTIRHVLQFGDSELFILQAKALGMMKIAGFKLVRSFLDCAFQVGFLSSNHWCDIVIGLEKAGSAVIDELFSSSADAVDAVRASLVIGTIIFASQEIPNDQPVFAEFIREQARWAYDNFPYMVVQVAPELCLALRNLNLKEQAGEWLRELTKPAGPSFKDCVLATYALSDIGRGDTASAANLLRDIRPATPEADRVRAALARVIAATAPEDAGTLLDGIGSDLEKMELASELANIAKFTALEANLQRLLLVLGTDAERFMELLQLLLDRHRDSEWLAKLRSELAPPAAADCLAQQVATILDRPEIAEVTKPKQLQKLKADLLANPAQLEPHVETLAIRMLVSNSLIDEDEARQLEATLPQRESQPA